MTIGGPAPPANSREAQKLATRARIRDAARGLFREHDFVAVSMEDIARHAEVGRATIYFHYSGKTALLTDLLIEDWDRQALLFEKLVTSPVLDRDALGAWLRRIVAGMRSARDFLSMHSYTLSQNKELAELHFAHRERLSGILAKRLPVFRLHAATQPGERRAWAASHMMIAQIEQFALFAARDLTEADAEDATEAMLDTLMTFIGSA